MTQPLSSTGGMLPTWLVVVGSAAILYHFVGIIIPILDTPSGPWPSQGWESFGDPPHFAHSASDLATLQGKYFRIAHSFHFDSNRPANTPGVEFEVRLKDADGKPLKTLRFPDPSANPWVRHRQEVLARALAPDLPVPPQEGEVLAPPGGKVPTLAIWLLQNENIDKRGMPPPPPSGKVVVLRLESVPLHLIPRNRDVWRPSDWALVLVRSYSRYLCRTHGAASAEVVRLTRSSVSPAVLFGNKVAPKEPNNPYSMVFEDLIANFEEVPQ
jgi:hypothetical protein